MRMVSTRPPRYEKSAVVLRVAAPCSSAPAIGAGHRRRARAEDRRPAAHRPMRRVRAKGLRRVAAASWSDAYFRGCRGRCGPLDWGQLRLIVLDQQIRQHAALAEAGGVLAMRENIVRQSSGCDRRGCIRRGRGYRVRKRFARPAPTLNRGLDCRRRHGAAVPGGVRAEAQAGKSHVAASNDRDRRDSRGNDPERPPPAGRARRVRAGGLCRLATTLDWRAAKPRLKLRSAPRNASPISA